MGGQAAGESAYKFPMMKHLKGNYSLLPLVGVLGFGCLLSVMHSGRQLTKNPDVTRKLYFLITRNIILFCFSLGFMESSWKPTSI
jgi:hypothetical protein